RYVVRVLVVVDAYLDDVGGRPTEKRDLVRDVLRGGPVQLSHHSPASLDAGRPDGVADPRRADRVAGPRRADGVGDPRGRRRRAGDPRRADDDVQVAPEAHDPAAGRGDLDDRRRAAGRRVGDAMAGRGDLDARRRAAPGRWRAKIGRAHV